MNTVIVSIYKLVNGKALRVEEHYHPNFNLIVLRVDKKSVRFDHIAMQMEVRDCIELSKYIHQENHA